MGYLGVPIRALKGVNLGVLFGPLFGPNPEIGVFGQIGLFYGFQWWVVAKQVVDLAIMPHLGVQKGSKRADLGVLKANRGPNRAQIAPFRGPDP